MTQVAGLANAINNFIVGCKADGTWDAIKACCIMGGWNNLNGALYPLKGAVPTNVNFVSGDYDRNTGLKGDASTKYLNSNRNNNADPQNSRHASVYLTAENTNYNYSRFIVAGDSSLGDTGINSGAVSPSDIGLRFYCTSNSYKSSLPETTIGLLGVVRSSASNFVFRGAQANQTVSFSSIAPRNETYTIFGRPLDSPARFANGRIAFYSIGESLDLALLDARVTTLLSAINAAIQDPYYGNVSLLLHGNGTNGSTTITDNSPYPKTITPVGNAQISTAQSKFGGASIAFDGTGDYLQSPSSTDFVLGTGDFTLETWVYPLGFASGPPNYNDYGSLFDFRTANAVQSNILLTPLGSSTIILYVDGSTRITGTSLALNQWAHVALTRNSGTTKLFINGTQAGSNYADTNNYTSSVFRAAGNIAGDTFNGYLDDLRITKGVARYTSNFTPPTTQFPDS
jgi:hypothetical protein